MININEKKDKINDLYDKFGQGVSKEEFEQILLCDPSTQYSFDGDIDNIGPIAFNLLLPRYKAGEKDFLNNFRRIKNACKLFLKRKNEIPKYLQNLEKYNSVEEFIQFMLNGQEPNIEKPAPKPSPLDRDYAKGWTNIPKDVFIKIVSADPSSKKDPEGNPIAIGQFSSQLLLPKYMSGETDFIDTLDNVTDAITSFIEKRNNKELNAALLNLRNYSSVKSFVDFILNNVDPGIAIVTSDEKSSSNNTSQEVIDKLEEYRRKSFPQIDKEVYDKIIELDPNTTEKSVGEIARKFLLPHYIAGDIDWVKDSDKTLRALTNYNKLAQNVKPPIDSFKSVEELVDKYFKVLPTFPPSNLVARLQNNENSIEDSPRWVGGRVKDTVKYWGSSEKFDVLQPLNPLANVAINEYGNDWCSGGFSSRALSSARSHFPSYGNTKEGRAIYCLINKNSPDIRGQNFQFYTTNNNTQMGYILDGHDGNFGYYQNEHKEKFKELFSRDPSLGSLLSNLSIFSNLKELQEAAKEAGAQVITSLEIKNEKDFEKALDAAFLETVIIDPSITSIPPATFMNNQNLSKVIFGDRNGNCNITVIGSQAFKNCTNLNKIVLPKGIKKIGSEAFANTSLKGSIDLPTSCIYIGLHAFNSTAAQLKILLPREQQINIYPDDKSWYIQNAVGKFINSNESLVLKEEWFNENLPGDLANAYKNSYHSTSTRHSNIYKNHNSLKNRNKVDFDYSNVTYEEMTPQEAIDYLQLSIAANGSGRTSLKDAPQTPHEYEGDNNLFWQRLSELRIITREGYAYAFGRTEGKKDGMGYTAIVSPPDTTQIYGISKADIYNIIRDAAKIYRTDEYSHLLNNQGTANRDLYTKIDHYDAKKIYPNPTTHDPLGDYNQRGGNDAYFYYNELDTGAHEKERINYFNRVGDKRSASYEKARSEKKDILQKINKLKSYLKKLKKDQEDNISDFDDKEYEDIYKENSTKLKVLLDNYKLKCEEVLKLKDELLRDTSAELNYIIRLENEVSKGDIPKKVLTDKDGNRLFTCTGELAYVADVESIKGQSNYIIQRILHDYKWVPKDEEGNPKAISPVISGNSANYSVTRNKGVYAIGIQEYWKSIILNLDKLEKEAHALDQEIDKKNAQKIIDTSEFKDIKKDVVDVEGAIRSIRNTAQQGISKLQQYLDIYPELKSQVDLLIKAQDETTNEKIQEVQYKAEHADEALFDASEDITKDLISIINDKKEAFIAIRKKIKGSGWGSNTKNTEKSLADGLVGIFNFISDSAEKANDIIDSVQ